MKAQTHAVRQDIVRGLRWGTVLVLVVLLGVAAYRMVISAPAVASEPAPTAIAPEPVPAQNAPVEAEPAAEPVLVTPPAVTKPAPKPRPAPSPNSGESVPPPPPKQRASFLATPVAKPAAPEPVVVDHALPESGAVSVDAALAVPGGETKLAPPPEGKPGRTGKIVRGVGRILRLGKKETDAKQ